MKTNLKLLIASSIIATLAFSCKNAPKENKSSTQGTTETASVSGGIIGSWKVSKAEGSFSSSYTGVVIKFTADKIMLNGVEDSYIISNDTITQKGQMGDTKFVYKTNNDQLVLNSLNIKGQILYLDKN